MKLLLAITLATAWWTGQSYNVTTVTGRHAIKCEYAYGNQRFWMTFERVSCPSSVEVR